MQKTACQISLPLHPDKEIRADFQGGRITSDAGWRSFGTIRDAFFMTDSFCPEYSGLHAATTARAAPNLLKRDSLPAARPSSIG